MRASRRSGASGTLNKATVPLLPKNRLVKELQDRGLDTSGVQTVLADRLVEFLSVEDGSISSPAVVKKAPAAAKKTPAAKTPKSATKVDSIRRSTRGAQQVKEEEPEEEEEEEEEQDEPVRETPKPKRRGRPSIKQEPPEEEAATEDAPVPEVPEVTERRKKQNKENATPLVKKDLKRKAPAVKIEEPEEPEPGTSQNEPSTSQNGKTTLSTTPQSEERRSRRKSARLLASEQMDVEDEDEPEAAADPEPPKIQEPEKKKQKVSIKEEVPDVAAAVVSQEPQEPPKKQKLTRIKVEVEEEDPDFQPPDESDPIRHSKRIKEHSEHSYDALQQTQKEKAERAEKLLKKQRTSSSSSQPSPAVSAQPKPANWQLEWAAKMAMHKKPAPATTNGVNPEHVKRKESGEKPAAEVATKKKKKEAIDTIEALMLSTIKEIVEKKPSIDRPDRPDRPERPERTVGGSDASDSSQGFLNKLTSQAAPAPSPKAQYPTGVFFNQPLPPPPAHPPKIGAHPLVMGGGGGVPMIPMVPMPPGMIGLPPGPPGRRRKSRFDQPPPEAAAAAQQFYASTHAPPPTLTTVPQISLRAPPGLASPIPPPPPGRKPLIDGIPPPPPKPLLATSDLQRRVQEIFSSESSAPAVPVVFSPREASPPPPPPPPRPSALKPKTEPKQVVLKQEPEEHDDDDDDFVIRDTVVEDEPAPRCRIEQEEASAPPAPVEPLEPLDPQQEDSAPRAVNKVVEQRKKEALAEERRRRAMELGDGDGEYNPEDSAIGQDESEIVWEYQPIMTRMEDEEEEMEENEGDDEDEDEMVMDDEEEDDDEDEEEATNLDAPEAPEALEAQEDPEELNVLEQNPMELLKRALPLLHSSTVTEQPKHDYAQLELPITESLLKRTDDEQPEEVYYHGDPVPEVDENELYEIAAGIKPKKKEKKALVQIPEEERVPADSETIELDYYNADILVKSAEKDIWQIEPFNQDGLALMWGGIRSNFGIKLPFKQTGKDASHRLAFQIQIDSYQSIQHLPTEFMADGGDVRIGFSLASTASLILGESPGSWCISASGKRAANNHFSDFGKLFDIGDVVTCIFDLSVGTISYQINGENVGSPFESLQFREGDVIFPTICTKNANINVNMGQELTDEKWKIPEDRDWMFITEMDRAHLVRSHTAPAAKKDCTVLMTVGLPGVGKTTWVRRYLAEHPHEHWTLISADVVMDAMKVNGVPRIRLPTLKRPDFLRGIIGKSMNRLILLAPRRRKNYILDMTNCFAEKRKRKLMAFEEFNRKCMLFVPDEDTHQKRLIKQEHEENEKLDTDAMMQHKAAMSLPIVAEGEPCEELIFIDPPAGCEQIAFDRVGKMNYDCRSWLVIPGRRRGGGGYNNHHNRGDRGGGGGNYHHGGYHQYNRPSTSGPPSGGAQYSPRGSSSSTMNITHTTFPSVPSPLVREEPTIILPPVKIGLPVVVSTADDSSSPTVAAAVVVAGNNQFSFPPPPVVMAAPASAAPQTPIQQQQKIQQVQQPKKVEVSQPLTLNTSSLPRKSTDSSAGPLSIVSSAGGRSSSFTQQSPRFATTPIPSVIPPTTTPVQQIPVMMNISQPPPQIMMSIPPPSMMVQHMRQPPVVFPIDVTVPPPNFSAPPPMLPASAGIPPHLLMYHHHQMSAPPPPTTTPQQAPQFSYPPPQFAPR